MRTIGLLAALLAVLPSTAAADSPAQSWYPATPAGMMVGGDTVLLADGRVLVASRQSSAGQTGDVIDQEIIAIYDPLTGAWSQSMPGAATDGNGAPTLMANGRVLFTGGASCSGINPGSCGALTSAQVFDPTSGGWSPVAPLPAPRDDHSAIRLADGSVLVVGGEAGRGAALGICAYPLTDAVRYDPDTDSWSGAGTLSLQETRCGFDLTLLPDGRVLATGGNRAIDYALLYDPATNTWTHSAPMTAARANSRATLLLSGKVLVVGGQTGNYSSDWLSSAEIYDPASDTWTVAAPMDRPHQGDFTATRLPFGEVLVAGGTAPCGDGCTQPTADADIYDPNFNQWRPAASMLATHADQHAVLLPSMAVLVVGGSAELYYERPLTPFDHQPPPVDSSPSWIYFPTTGHYLANGFRACWEQSGGLVVFGYPLTEEFVAPDPDTPRPQVVQYTERARFEYFGDDYSSGAPCNPHLGRVGAELAQARGLLDSAPFRRLASATGRDANCQFFVETGHRLCFGFKAYWQSHGLAIGDQYDAYWQSVALFGYPISEEYTDPATGVTVQYFERARFEYHPENPEPFKVQLGRVGAELLVARGA